MMKNNQSNLKLKKKRISRKLKSSWRKNVDITDVEDFLENQRQEERIGSVADKSDLELFSIEPSHSNKKVMTVQEKRKKLLDSVPKCYSALENTSKVSDPIAKRNYKINSVQKVHKGKISKSSKNADSKKLKKTFKTDLWGDEKNELAEAPQELLSEWCNKDLVLHTLTNTGKPLVKIHKTLHQKTSKLTAIETPHPGVSYNPTFDDHQDLVAKVIDREEKIIKTEEHFNRCVTDKFTKIPVEEKEKLIYEEMTEGLNLNGTNEEDINEENDSSNDEEYKAINPPVRNKKKDKKAKRKRSEAIERANQKQMIDQELQKFKDINKIIEFKKDIEKTTEKVGKKKINRKQREEEKNYNPRRVGYQKYEEPETDFTEVKDLTSNLRNMIPGSSLMVDRFKSLQKRNIIPPKNKKRKVGGKARSRHRLGKFAKYTLKSHKES